MGLESASFVNDLNTSNPTATDPKAQGDDHLRLIKTALKASFPNSNRALYIPSSVAAQTATVNVAAADQGKVYPVNATSGAITVNLPANAGIPDGYEVTVFKSDSSSNNVTIDGNSSDTINGAATYVLTKQYQGIRLIWLSTFASWVGLPWINAIPYFAGGQDIALTDIAPSGNAKRILAATTATDWSEHTAAAVLEFISASLARGDLLMRGASAFDRFAPGTAGYFLRSGGATADLIWSAGLARGYGEYTGNTSFSGTIPDDDTIPQSGEGDQIVTASITLNNASNRVRASFTGWATCAISVPTLIVALFSSESANAINVIKLRHDNDDPTTNAHLVHLEVEHAPGAVGPLTYQVRAGCNNEYTFNGAAGSRTFGGASRASLILQEIQV